MMKNNFIFIRHIRDAIEKIKKYLNKAYLCTEKYFKGLLRFVITTLAMTIYYQNIKF